MKLKDTIEIHGTGETWLNHPPGLVTDTPKVRDIARKRLVKTNPDVDAAKITKKNKANYKEKRQTDENAFTGKRFRTQDTKYGHLINEFDSSEEAFKSSLARPYTRVLRHREPTQTASFRNKTRKKVVNTNPDNPD
jgi:hypothetical protein